MRRFWLRRNLFGAEITAEFSLLDEGLQVMLFGGERAHVGAVALAQNGKLTMSGTFPGHKEQALCEQWALALSRQTGGCVAVCGGIHYDNATSEQILEILDTCDGILQQAIETLQAGVQLIPEGPLSLQMFP